MKNKFNLNTLTENIRNRDVGAEDQRLVEKWSRTGLLRGLEAQKRDNMARMLENQAAQLMKEASTVGASGAESGDLRGFQNIAFPIVRRVFGNLIANELVSVQPMSLPSGLLFYLDYTYGSNVPGADTSAEDYQAFTAGNSLYGGGAAGASIQYGTDGTGGMYDLGGNSYSLRYTETAAGITAVASGTFGTSVTLQEGDSGDNWGVVDMVHAASDPTYATSSLASEHMWFVHTLASITDGVAAMNRANVDTLTVNHGTNADISGTVRHLSQIGTYSATTGWTRDFESGTHVLTLCKFNDDLKNAANPGVDLDMVYATTDTLDTNTDGSALTIPSWEGDTSAGTSAIHEIDIKVESVAVTAQSRKLRAKWTPELAQDLNAYHNLDAEVELTQILSEQIALEIDNEILSDLIAGAGTNYFWSRSPGKYVNKVTGREDTSASFTGTTQEWYQTLVERIIDVANTIHRKTLRGSANFIVVSPDVATILESTLTFKPDVKFSDGQAGDKFGLGAEAIGSLSSRFTVYKDAYFPRSAVLVGFKGNSFLSSGFIYAPYIPLIVTPTIFQHDDFTPRKGVMTRYGKAMVRADFYGVVRVLDMNI